jgi:DNA polymerase III subunit delta'
MTGSIYPWQQKQWQLLTARLENKRLPHGLLLTGQPGLGKTAFALAFAELLLQSSKQLFQAGTHPDFLLVQPEENSKTIKIEQIRAITEMVSNSSHQGGYQVVIINPADAMNITANNALLKTLEEPPGLVVLMLITDCPSSLPATILSRCQQLHFYPPAKKIVLEWLRAKGHDSDDNLDAALNFAENSPLIALELLQSGKISERTKLFNSLHQLLEKKIDPIEFAEQWQDMELRDSLNYLQLALLALIKTDINNTKLFKCLDKTQAAVKALTNNLNKQLVLEDIGAELTC